MFWEYIDFDHVLKKRFNGFDLFKNEISTQYYWDITSWYQSLGLRDSNTLSSVAELKLRN